MMRICICSICGRRFNRDDKLINGDPIKSPCCNENSYFKYTKEKEPIPVLKVKGES